MKCRINLMKLIFSPVVFCLGFSSILTAQMDSKFYHPGKVMLPIDDHNYEQVSLTSDTAKLSGIFIKPTIKPVGTVLFLHGDSGNVSNYVFMARPLVKDGYQVFMVDFRG